MAKAIPVKLTDLKTSFFVRKKLDDDHVVQLALLYEENTELPALRISKNFEIIDGRHRKAALELAGRTFAMCIVEADVPQADLICSALKANMGGSLPPTKQDIIHSMILLLNNGWSERKIVENVPLPRPVTRKYMQEAWGAVLEIKLKAAMKGIAEDGLTAKEASEKFSVPIDKLKKHMNPDRKRKQANSVAWKRQHLARAFQGWHKKVGHMMADMVEGYEDSVYKESDVYEFMEHVINLSRKAEKLVEDRRERFQKITEEHEKIASI